MKFCFKSKFWITQIPDLLDLKCLITFPLHGVRIQYVNISAVWAEFGAIQFGAIRFRHYSTRPNFLYFSIFIFMINCEYVRYPRLYSDLRSSSIDDHTLISDSEFMVIGITNSLKTYSIYLRYLI